MDFDFHQQFKDYSNIELLKIVRQPANYQLAAVAICQSYLFFKYQNIHQGNTIAYLLPIAIRTVFVAFLWRDSIADHFGVSRNTKKDTALITTAGTLALVLTFYFLFA